MRKARGHRALHRRGTDTGLNQKDIVLPHLPAMELQRSLRHVLIHHEEFAKGLEFFCKGSNNDDQ